MTCQSHPRAYPAENGDPSHDRSPSLPGKKNPDFHADPSQPPMSRKHGPSLQSLFQAAVTSAGIGGAASTFVQTTKCCTPPTPSAAPEERERRPRLSPSVILVPQRSLVVLDAPPYQSVRFQLLQASRHHLRCPSGLGLDLLEPAHAHEELTKRKHGPVISDDGLNIAFIVLIFSASAYF